MKPKAISGVRLLILIKPQNREGYENGITADVDDKMKKVAEKHQKTPLDLFEMMK